MAKKKGEQIELQNEIQVLEERAGPSFYERQTVPLGVTKKNNVVLRRYDEKGEKVSDKKKMARQPIFEEDKHGNLVIHYYDLNGCQCLFRRGNNKHPDKYDLVRLKEPREHANGDVMKYRIPKGAGTFPFLPPSLIDKYNKKEKIKTLVATEGAKKAFCGSIHGLDIIGLTSITHYRDKDTKAMHHDILEIIKVCQVEHFVWLVDGDCLDLSQKWTRAEDQDKAEKIDLYTRPASFFNSARNIQLLLTDHPVHIFFTHVASDQVKGEPKGLDDLIMAKQEMDGQKAPAEVVADLMAMSKQHTYFHRIDITNSMAKLRAYFHLQDAKSFYDHYGERIQERQFTFHGTKYQYNSSKGELDTKVPGAAKFYVRVGDQYHKWVSVPNKYNQLERRLDRRQKSTIIDDHNKHFVEHIMKLDAFCNVPDHVNYQAVIKNCLNRYHEFEHQPSEQEKEEKLEENCPATLSFLAHIFGNDKIKYKRKSDKETVVVTGLQLGLDFVQLLYSKPTQKLPILCLVSRENKTGKTTFASWLKLIFTQNMAIVGNADLANDFNASWATKLLVCCDEAKIDKQVVVERIKSLSTADKILMNQKGKDHVEIDFFGKFLLLTNNEDNFIYASDDDTRYWIRKVHAITEEDRNVHLIEDMQDEIPYFLAYLSKRKLSTENEDRMWFAHNLIRTDALKRVIEYSRPAVEKQLSTVLRDLFLTFNVKDIYMNTTNIDDEMFRSKYKNEHHYLNKVISEMGIEQFKNDSGKVVTKRYQYPKIVNKMQDGVPVPEPIMVSEIGRPWRFLRKDFVSTEDEEATEMDSEAKHNVDFLNNPMSEKGETMLKERVEPEF